MDDHGALRRRTLVVIALIGAGLTELTLTLLERGDLPTGQPSWVLGLLLVAVAGGLGFAGRRIRATRRGDAARPVPPIAAYRILLFAQACALAGALAVGAYTMFVLRGLPDLDAASVQAEVVAAVVSAIGGAALVGAGLWVQSVCRIDPPDDPGEESPA